MFAIVMMPEIHRHMDTEELERYSMGDIAQPDAERIEEHLLLCELCRRQLEETELYVTAMRRAAAELQLQPEKRSWWRRHFPALTLAACVIVIVVLALPWGSQQPPIAVNLVATRANAGQAAPAGHPLLLHPDLTGVLPALSYRLEMVNRDGGPVWGGVLLPPEAGARIPRQPAGTYFIRLYTRSGELLREYGLEIK
jgi:hypothetical protein